MHAIESHHVSSIEPYILESTLILPRPLSEVFPFFAAPENLEAITPPWLHFKILTPSPIQMKVGALIDYRIRLHGVPIRWRTKISAYDPPHLFVDAQIKGPYLLWEHTHVFESVPGAAGTPAGTRVTDRVRYIPRDIPRSVPLLGARIHRHFVRPELERIFAYRASKIRKLLCSR